MVDSALTAVVLSDGAFVDRVPPRCRRGLCSGDSPSFKTALFWYLLVLCTAGDGGEVGDLEGWIDVTVVC